MSSNGTWLETIVEVLTINDNPMSSEEIYSRIKTNLEADHSKGSAISNISSTLSREISTKKNASCVVRLAKGKFGLRLWLNREEFKEYKIDRGKKRPIDEVIAVIPKKQLKKFITSTGISLSGIPEDLILNKYLSQVRHEAEEDFDVIQLVSVFIVHDGQKVITHKRAKRSPESRLHDEYSIMFGGHILSQDLSSLFNPFDVDSQIGFISRELEEEVILKSNYSITPIGLIYDDSREVSSQHIGLIFTVRTNPFSHEIGEKGFLIDPRVESIEDLKRRINDFENWSASLINNLEKIFKREKELRND